jgi:hypothetical protein
MKKLTVIKLHAGHTITKQTQNKSNGGIRPPEIDGITKN